MSFSPGRRFVGYHPSPPLKPGGGDEIFKRVAQTDASVPFTGESGVGERTFRAGFALPSLRCQFAWVDLTELGTPVSHLVESELFGLRKAPFSGVPCRRKHVCSNSLTPDTLPGRDWRP